MKRYSEVVLNGHPDKFCDLIADRIISHAYKSDNEAYAQIEVAVWSDQLFLTGAVVTKQKLEFDLREIIIQIGEEIGYAKYNHIDVTQYKIHNHICWLTNKPQEWTHFVNDQSIVIGYAGYNAKTNFLPPEHFAAWYFRENIIKDLKDGSLIDQGPDGKILIVIDENENEWRIKKFLLTLQQKENYAYTDFTFDCSKLLYKIFNQLQQHDSRWIGEWKDIEVMINPNGSFIKGGSDGDNGQTGRKLVMDYYGPRIPLGGGAIYGKDLSHIDRIASFAARKYSLELIAHGANDVNIVLCYAPGKNMPIDISLRTNIKPHIDPYEYFDFNEMHKLINCSNINYDLSSLGTFYNPELSFNKVEFA